MSWEDEEYVPDIPVHLDADAVTDKTLQELAAPPPPTAPAAPAAPLVVKQKHLEKEARLRHEAEAARDREAARASRALDGEALADPAAERRRQEALQQRADLDAAADSLGASTGKRMLSTDVASLMGAVTLTENDHFKALGRLASQRVHTVRPSFPPTPKPPPRARAPHPPAHLPTRPYPATTPPPLPPPRRSCATGPR